jgi:exopolysaccharide biosynthesis polyprenyl glycosylphosphotransferase
LSFVVPLATYEIPAILYVLVPFIWTLTFLVSSVYEQRRVYKVVDEFQLVTFATGVAALLCAGLFYLTFRDLSRWLFVIFVVIDFVLILGWRVIARLVFKMGRIPAVERLVLIVGAGVVGQRVGLMLQEYDWTGLRLAGYLDDEPDKKNGRNPLPVLGKLGEVRAIVEERRIDDVVIALPQRAYGQVNELVLTLHDLPVQVRVVPDYFSLALYRAKAEDFGGLPMINLRDPALSEFQPVMKRLFDLSVGLMSFALALPFMGLIALAIKLDSSGPVLFRQQRVGENGRLFCMYKFRTMTNGADKMQHQVNETNGDGYVIHKRKDDPRVTRVGRFLRRTSLDEIPQLINVLKGEMSLVGPRPEMPWLVDSYEPWQHKRFAVPQGMTGWWQVNGRSEKPMHLHTEDDLYYVQNYSLWMDLYILIKTPLVVLKGKGAY